MKRETAELLLQVAADVTARLNESLRTVQQNDSEEVFVAYRRTVGKLMGALFDDVMSPIFRSFPDLNPEELRGPGSADSSRPFKATHRITIEGEPAFEVMLYSSDASASVAHTRDQWSAFRAQEIVLGPYWCRVNGQWWRDGTCESGASIEPVS